MQRETIKKGVVSPVWKRGAKILLFFLPALLLIAHMGYSKTDGDRSDRIRELNEEEGGMGTDLYSNFFAGKSHINYTEFPYKTSLGYHAEQNRGECMKNLTLITGAMMRYAEAHEGKLPPVYSTDKKGAPLHSWRVLILPYFAYPHTSLRYMYEQIRLDEPWDSEWNRQFHDCLPEVYACFSQEYYSDARDNMKRKDSTCYTVITGPDTPFPTPQNGEGLLLDEIGDKNGAVLVMERNEPVCWMKPDAEMTAEEVTSGDFLKKMSSVPRHCDPDGDFYIPAAFCYRTVIINKYVTQEQLSNMTLRRLTGKEELRLRNRVVSFK
ncbi:MAG: DUF1559 domain-containing protein [Thermoguttaceae bacterium]|nr:DUF1559 domain-containing protein [Thermoguttaceae bacterium]